MSANTGRMNPSVCRKGSLRISRKLSDSLNTELRQRWFVRALGGALKSTSYVSAHNLCSSLFSPFVIVAENDEDVVAAILSWLRDTENDTVLIDSRDQQERYLEAGFQAFPFASNSWIDVADYSNIDGYYAGHKTTRKKIARSLRGGRMIMNTYSGKVPNDVVLGMKACLACSRDHSKGVLPFQEFFEGGIFKTDAVTSDAYGHFVTTVGGRVAGFHSFLPCGKRFGGVMGGFDRESMGKEPVYDLTIVSALEYAIEYGYEQLCFSIVDNYTKQRMMDRFESQNLYFYSGKKISRSVFRRIYPYSSGWELQQMELDAIAKRGKVLQARKS